MSRGVPSAETAPAIPSSSLSQKIFHGVRNISAGFGALCMTGIGGYAYMHYSTNSGHVERHAASSRPNSPQPEGLRILSWNLHKEQGIAHELAVVADQYNADVVVAQEVTEGSLWEIERQFHDWDRIMINADRKANFMTGRFGNLILTRYESRDVKSRAIAGTGLTETGTRTTSNLENAVTEGKNLWEAVKDGRQEDRAIGSVVVNMMVNGEKKPVRVATTHIAGGRKAPELHKEQYAEVLDFMQDTNDKDTASVMCGDLNSDKRETIPAFGQIGFVVPDTTNTVVGKPNKTVDFCTYEAGWLGYGRATVLKDHETDHHPLLIEFIQPSIE